MRLKDAIKFWFFIKFERVLILNLKFFIDAFRYVLIIKESINSKYRLEENTI